MGANLFEGAQVRLIAPDPDAIGKLYEGWARDSEFMQLFDSDPALPRSVSRWREMTIEHSPAARPGTYSFAIQRLEDDQVIGITSLWNTLRPARNAMVAIGIGDRASWGRGYGSDAMQIVLRFAFRELNQHRVSLITFGYNVRAVRSYEKVGFRLEGNLHGGLRRYGERSDLVAMGILKREWEQRQVNEHQSV